MDPAAAFSLAGTVLQFIETASKFVALAWNLYQAEADAADDLAVVSQLNSALCRVLNELSPDKSADKTSEPGNDGIVQLASDCGKVASQLLSVLQSIKLPEKEGYRKRDALKAAFKLIWKENQIRALQSRLEGFRGQLNLHLLLSLRNYASRSAEQQEEILEKLGLVCSKAPIRETTCSILQSISSKGYSGASDRNAVDMLQAGLFDALCQTSQHADVATTPILRLPRVDGVEDLIIHKLYYHDMTNRENRIKEAYESTFQWVLNDDQVQNRKWTSLRQWLESEDQVYWITGKAGSGKSTLMKYLCASNISRQAAVAPGNSLVFQRSRCHPLLERWAGTSSLIIASFYFWNSGAALQMTSAGLLRSLLYQILIQHRDILPAIAPKRWEGLGLIGYDPGDWTQPELSEMLQLAAKELAKDWKLCLFVDGLDEFDGEHEELITLFRDLVRDNAHVKVCVASRPWVVFQDAFQKNSNLRLEDLTYEDIKHYASSRLLEDAEFAKLRHRDPNFADQLIENIILKASGVFLWVHLVVKSLIAGMCYGDRVADLQRRLDFLPPDLENLYDKMLHSLDPFYLEHAAQFFALVECAETPLTVLQFCFADEESPESAIQMPIGVMNEGRLALRLDVMNRRINSRCKGLLEIDRTPLATDGSERTVQYLHRTVRDFIVTEKAQQFLRSSMKSNFDPHMGLCIAYMLSAKVHRHGQADMEMIRSCLRNAAHITKANERAMIVLLDDLAHTLGVVTARRGQTTSLEDKHRSSAFKSRYHVESGRLLQVHYCKESVSYLGQDWDDTRMNGFGSSGETFLSLTVMYGVIPYVKARTTRGGLVQRPCCEGRAVIWPLLLDALATDPPNPGMVKCLLDLKADPNFECQLPFRQTPWKRVVTWLFKLGAFDHTIDVSQVQSSQNLDKNWVDVLGLMISRGVDMNPELLVDFLREDLGWSKHDTILSLRWRWLDRFLRNEEKQQEQQLARFFYFWAFKPKSTTVSERWRTSREQAHRLSADLDTNLNADLDGGLDGGLGAALEALELDTIPLEVMRSGTARDVIARELH